MAWIGGAALLVNIPLGYMREGRRRYSPGWFLFVHLSIPLIAWLRMSHGVTQWAIPSFIACAVIGQIAGGRIRRRARRDP